MVFYTSRRRNQPSGSSQRAEGGGAPQLQTTRARGGRQGDTGSHRAPARQHRSRHGWQGRASGAARGGGAWPASGERFVAKAYSADCNGEGHNERAARSDAPPLRTELVPGGVRGGHALQTATGQQGAALAAHPGRGGLFVGHRLSLRTGARPPQSPWWAWHEGVGRGQQGGMGHEEPPGSGAPPPAVGAGRRGEVGEQLA